MKHTFFTFVALLSFVTVSLGVPLQVRAVNTGAGFDIEESLSGMDPWADIAGVALTCVAGQAMADTVVPAVSAITGAIANLFSPVGAILSGGTNVAADTEAGIITGVLGGTAVGATATVVEEIASVPTSNLVLQTTELAKLNLAAASAAAKEPKEAQSRMTGGVSDCIVYNAGQQMLQQLTDNTVKWIQGGFQGSPSFTVNTHEIFLDLADMVAGDLARELRGISMCNFSVNFKNDLSNTVELSGKKDRRFAGKTKCPFPETFNLNSSDFYKGVNQFSWGAMELAMQDNGNPFGVALLTGEELARRSLEKQEVRKQELAWSNGFTNIVDTENCKYRPSVVRAVTGGEGTMITQDEWNQAIADEIVTKTEVREYQKEACKTTTPGKMLGDKLTEATGVDMQRLGMIDNINKIIGAFISQITKQAALGIFNAVSGEDAELETDYATVQEKTAQTMAMENAALKPYYDIWQAEIQKKEGAEAKLARLEAEKEATDNIDQILRLNDQIREQEAIIAAAPEKIATAKAAYDEAASAERSIARQEELVAAQAEYDAARIALQVAETSLLNAKRKYADYLSGSISGGTYIPPDTATLESYRQNVMYADDAYRQARLDFDSASNRLYAARNPAYVAPLQ